MTPGQSAVFSNQNNPNGDIPQSMKRSDPPPAAKKCSNPLSKDLKSIRRQFLLKSTLKLPARKPVGKYENQSVLGTRTTNTSVAVSKFPGELISKSEFLSSLITNIPEITEEFDVPEYIILDDERRVELDVICKYITNPVCDENGFYINDHDYLGLPIIRIKTETRPRRAPRDHDYSVSPACLYADLRYFCNICGSNTSDLFSFNTHMMLHTVENVLVCPICGLKCLTTTCLNAHISTHQTVCEYCGSGVPLIQVGAHQEAYFQQKRDFDEKNKIPDCLKVKFCIRCMNSCQGKCLKLRRKKEKGK